MNERIKELAKQSGLIQYDSDGKMVDAEKFAQLIVKECAEVAGCNAHASGFALSDLIKEHFGVE